MLSTLADRIEGIATDTVALNVRIDLLTIANEVRMLEGAMHGFKRKVYELECKAKRSARRFFWKGVGTL